ncbi:MAG: SprT family zinc-dependent metalloprotease [Ferrimonas sp.]
MSEPLFQAICAQVEQCYQLAEQQLQRAFPRPNIAFNQRGQAAGSAYLQRNQLRFNPILARANPEAFLQQVVPHEVAHLLVWHCYGKTKPHGLEWQRLMIQLFGVTPTVRHSFDVSAVQPRTVAYRCQCQIHQLTIRRHNKLQRGQAQYQCRLCQSQLQLA